LVEPGTDGAQLLRQWNEIQREFFGTAESLCDGN